ncbi:MAG: FAD-binding oxidoreductase, partial [Micromonosporaceae bacterium]
MTAKETSPAHRTRSWWGWGWETEALTDAQCAALGAQLPGLPSQPLPVPALDGVDLPRPRISPPGTLAHRVSAAPRDRAGHTYGKAYRDVMRALCGDLAAAPDAVAFPRSESEIVDVLDWASAHNVAVIPYGAGSSVVGGTEYREGDGAGGHAGVLSLDLSAMDRVLEVDPVSRAARIQAGALGPVLEDQLRPHGYTLRHFPQSFEFSTLGGWLATRAGGHYATLHTHIDDFVESVRALTPRGWWESRRLPASGAGPSPDRLLIGSEGILGVITEAWMRVQDRPRFRATAGVLFPSWEAGYAATREIVQAKLWPANLRLLDPELAGQMGLDGEHALLIIGFESAVLSQRGPMTQAVEMARAAGGLIEDDEVLIDDGTGAPTGRSGAVGAWRDAFIPKGGSLTAGLGMIGGTFETAITWERWPDFDHAVRTATHAALREVCGGGTLNCRFTHVYPDGPAPYYTYAGAYRPGADEVEQHAAIKKAASDAIMAAGGTITHHHAVGRQH